jgi:hypothetical protein
MVGGSAQPAKNRVLGLGVWRFAARGVYAAAKALSNFARIAV